MENEFKLETERLILRPHQRDDLSFMIELNADPDVNLYTGDGTISEDEALKIITKFIQAI